MNREGTSLPQRTFDGDMAPMGLNNVFDNGQTEPGTAEFAAAGFVHPVKSFEKPRQVLVRYAGPLVGKFYRDLAFLLSGSDPDLAAVVTVLDGIVN